MYKCPLSVIARHIRVAFLSVSVVASAQFEAGNSPAFGG